MDLRKRIAVYANGWNVIQLVGILKGMKECAMEHDVDIYAFVNYSTRPDISNINSGETIIYGLSILDQMDGVIFVSNSFNTARELELVYPEVKKRNMPAVSVEFDLDGMACVSTDNYSGMYDLVEHMICAHGMKDILFVTGPVDHADSIARMKAARDACEKYGIHYGDDNVFAGDWGDAETKAILNRHYEEHRCIPEAVICANDIMALAACEWMDEHGFRVPEDCAVTGYDCVTRGQSKHPLLTTVKQNNDEQGRKCLEILLEQMNGREVPKRTVQSASLHVGESCGCRIEEESEEMSEERDRPSGIKHDLMNCDQHFRNMYNSVRKVDDLVGLHHSLNYFFKDDNWMEGRNFLICLEPEFFREKEYGEGDPTTCSDRMDVILQVINGEPQQRWSGSHSDILFDMSRRNDKAQLYFVVALHSDEKAMGYVVLNRDEEILKDFILYIWTRHMNQYMEQVRQNMLVRELTQKLTKLTVTDALTGVYNRAGCERIGYPALERYQAEGRQSAMMIADVDRMKTINDYFGHAQGDRALCMVAKVLRESLPEDWIISRYGGDEFFMAGICEDFTMDELVQKITERLDQEKEAENIPFHLTLSVGGTVLAKGEPFDLLKCLQKADSYMYEMKKKRHIEIDGR